MKKLLTMLLGCLMLTAGAAEASLCYFQPGASNWGPVGIVTGAGGVICVPPGVPTGADVFYVQEGADVTVIDTLTFTADGAGIICQNGGSLTADAAAVDAGIGMLFWDGQDMGLETNVAIYAEPSCELNLSGGFRQWGPDPAEAQATHTLDNQTEWTVDYIDPCDDSGDVTDEIDCSSDANLLCLVWTDARSQNIAVADEPGDNHLDEAIGAIDAGMDEACFIGDSADSGTCYPIESVSYAAGVSVMCLDVRQVPWQGTGVSQDMPYSRRDIQWNAGGVQTSVNEGATCVNVPAVMINYAGEFVGRWFRPQGEEYPYLISRTEQVQCDDLTAGASIHLIAPLRKAIDITAEEDFTIDYGIARGDTFVVVAPVAITCNEDEIAAGECKIIIHSTEADLRQVFIGDSGEVRFENGAFGNWDGIHARACGDAGTGQAAVRFKSLHNPEVNWLTVTGGESKSGGSLAVVYEDTDGTARLTNTNIRYPGSTGITTTADPAGDRLLIDRLKLEQLGYLGYQDGIIYNDQGSPDGFDRVEMRNVLCTDCAGWDDGSNQNVALLSHNDHPMIINNMAVVGLPRGILANDLNATVSLGIKISNLLLRDMRGLVDNTTTGSMLPRTLDHCDVRSIKETAATNQSVLWGTGTYETNVTNCIISDVTLKNRVPIRTGGPGVQFKNNILWNILNSYSDTDCSGATASCALIDLIEPNTAGIWEVIENITIGWDEGVTVPYNYGIRMITSGSGHAAEDSYRFGATLIYNMDNNLAGAASVVYGQSILSDILDLARYSAGPHAVFHIGASAGATPVDLDNLANYPTESILRGYLPRFVNPDNGESFAMLGDSKLANLETGARTGVAQPGVMRNGTKWIYDMIGVTPPLQGRAWSMPWAH